MIFLPVWNWETIESFFFSLLVGTIFKHSFLLIQISFRKDGLKTCRIQSFCLLKVLSIYLSDFCNSIWTEWCTSIMAVIFPLHRFIQSKCFHMWVIRFCLALIVLRSQFAREWMPFSPDAPCIANERERERHLHF